MVKPVIFAQRPTREQALREVEKFFAYLASGDVDAAGACVTHKYTDWWPHQVKALWQDLAVPYLEDQGVDADLDDDVSWRDVSWLRTIGAEQDPKWDGEEDWFFVNVVYEGVVTDTSAEFSLVKQEDGWVLRRDLIHVA